MFPIEKYKFITYGRTVIAISTDAGETVKAKAVCHEDDTFDLEIGKQLAAARCNIKIAKRRAKRAADKVDGYEEAIRWLNHKHAMACVIEVKESENYYNAVSKYNSLLHKIKSE